MNSVKRIAAASVLAAAALFAVPTAAHAATTCTATYAGLDLYSRSASWGVSCDGDAVVFVDAYVYYNAGPAAPATTSLVSLPQAGAHTVKAGETWFVWTQDNTHTGAADHGVVHIVKDNGTGPATLLAHVQQ